MERDVLIDAALRFTGQTDAEKLSNSALLTAVKTYLIHKRVPDLETSYRINLARIGTYSVDAYRDPRAAAMLAFSLISIGQASTAYLNGTADVLETEMIEMGAAIAGWISDAAVDTAARAQEASYWFREFRKLDAYMLAVRDGSRLAINSATTIQDAFEAFETAKSRADQLMDACRSGADIRALLDVEDAE